MKKTDWWCAWQSWWWCVVTKLIHCMLWPSVLEKDSTVLWVYRYQRVQVKQEEKVIQLCPLQVVVVATWVLLVILHVVTTTPVGHTYAYYTCVWSLCVSIHCGAAWIHSPTVSWMSSYIVASKLVVLLSSQFLLSLKVCHLYCHLVEVFIVSLWPPFMLYSCSLQHPTLLSIFYMCSCFVHGGRSTGC